MNLLHSIIRSIFDKVSKEGIASAKTEHVNQPLQDDHAWPLIWSENIKRYN